MFHVQQDLTRATSAPINAKVKQAEKSYETSKKVKEYNIRENPDLCAELDKEIILEEMVAEAALIRLNELIKHWVQ